MSMTREEAIKLLKQYQGYEPMFPDGETLKHAFDLTDETVDTLLSALRPVSREQVEKVFGGKWEEETYTTVSGRCRVIHSKKCTCSACGKANGRAKTNFCPHCGAPMTDEAVDMVMERMDRCINLT